jgi:hypothetical protein
MVAGEEQPLIGIPVRDGDREVVHYFADEADADRALSQDSTQAALSLAGAWSDLDYDQAMEELDRIRHESRPTPGLDRCAPPLTTRTRQWPELW